MHIIYRFINLKFEKFTGINVHSCESTKRVHFKQDVRMTGLIIFT